MCVWVYIYTYIHTCMYMYLIQDAHAHTRIHIYIYVYICICICMHIYIYICIHDLTLTPLETRKCRHAASARLYSCTAPEKLRAAVLPASDAPEPLPRSLNPLDSVEGLGINIYSLSKAKALR